MTCRVVFLPGAQKAATSTMFQLLEAHPGIHASGRKEPHYFSKDALGSPTREAYLEAVFPGRSGNAICLDASQSYLAVEGVPERIRRAFGEEPRFVVVLRDPVDRAVSAFRYFRARVGRESRREFRDIVPPELEGMDLEALLAWEREAVRRALSTGDVEVEEPAWFRAGYPFRYFYVGAYGVHLERYLARFPRKRFLFLRFEDVTRRQEWTRRRALRFLGLEAGEPEWVRHANPTLVYRDATVGRLARGLRRSLKPWRDLVPGRWRRRVRSLEESILLQRVPDDFDPRTKGRLIEIFVPEIERTESLTGLDLSAWKRPADEGSGDPPEDA